MNITPAVLPHSFEEIAEKLSRIEGLANHIQIDLCDGVFGREKTWLPQGTEILPSGFTYEFDVMLNDWNLYVMHCLTLGATSIIVHVDTFSDADLEALIAMITPHQVTLGIAVSNDKSLDFHADMVRKARALYSKVFIQVMGIRNIGEQGQIFDESTPERVQALKAQFGEATIQVDGGIIPETAKKVQQAGADTIVVGSYLFGSSEIGEAYGSLSELCV